MGLINKLFFDYIKNYRYQNKGFFPKSYVYLYFSCEPQYDLKATFDLMTTIIGIYPLGHKITPFTVVRKGVLYGIILIIDRLNDLSEVRDLYRRNPHIHCYVNPIEDGWEKHKILMDIKDPW